jgi:hypothetical protein
MTLWPREKVVSFATPKASIREPSGLIGSASVEAVRSAQQRPDAARLRGQQASRASAQTAIASCRTSQILHSNFRSQRIATQMTTQQRYSIDLKGFFTSVLSLRNGVTLLTATAGGGTNALLGDIKKLLGAISPAPPPVIIANSVQAASIAVLSQTPLPVIAAPTLAADQIIAIDAAAFSSALGLPLFNISEDPTVHLESAAPMPIGTPGSPATIAAPTQSLWQTAAIGMRCLIDADWLLRRTGSIATVTGVTW